MPMKYHTRFERPTSETQSNNQLKKMLLPVFISIYLAILFDHFKIYICKYFVLETLSSRYAYEALCNV
jgi:hypothetical protein